jgi:hypothetical protein
MPDGSEENSNDDFRDVYNLIDSYALRTGAAIVLIHHSSKGNQSDKAVTDVGAGAGAMVRAADTQVVLREHEQPGAVVMEAVARSWPPITPLCLVWEFPTWKPSNLLDPMALKKRTGKPKEKPKVWTAQMFADECLTAEPQSKAVILEAAGEAGMSERRAGRLLSSCLAKNLAYPWKDKDDGRQKLYATEPEPALAL